MKQILMTVCVVTLALFVAGCEKSEAIRVQNQVQQAQRLQVNANGVIANIQYIKDSGVGLCFAYYMSGVNSIREALATVPCEAIPPQLLTVTK